MVKVCTFPSCKNKQRKKDQSYNHIQFHSFPLGRNEVLEKWVEAVGRGGDWRPGRASRVCSAHFAPDCFKETSGPRRLLHPEAVPTLHCATTAPCVPTHPPSRTGTRKDPMIWTVPPTNLQIIRTRYAPKLKELRRKNKILKLRLMRRDLRLKELRTRLVGMRTLVERRAKVASASDRLEGFIKELLDHSIKNSETKRTGIRYSGVLREFALTLYLHSPRAYLYVRSLLRLLPNPSLIKKWIANFNRPAATVQTTELCTTIPTEVIITESTDVTTTEELIIEDIDSFIVIEDPVDMETCMAGGGDPSSVNSIPVMVAQHVQIH